MDNLDENKAGLGIDIQTVWEIMRMQGITIENIDKMFDGTKISEDEILNIKKDVNDFEDNITYPYIIKLDAVDIHIDEKSCIRIPYDTE